MNFRFLHFGRVWLKVWSKYAIEYEQIERISQVHTELKQLSSEALIRTNFSSIYFWFVLSDNEISRTELNFDFIATIHQVHGFVSCIGVSGSLRKWDGKMLSTHSHNRPLTAKNAFYYL